MSQSSTINYAKAVASVTQNKKLEQVDLACLKKAYEDTADYLNFEVHEPLNELKITTYKRVLKKDLLKEGKVQRKKSPSMLYSDLDKGKMFRDIVDGTYLKEEPLVWQSPEFSQICASSQSTTAKVPKLTQEEYMCYLLRNSTPYKPSFIIRNKEGLPVYWSMFPDLNLEDTRIFVEKFRELFGANISDPIVKAYGKQAPYEYGNFLAMGDSQFQAPYLKVYALVIKLFYYNLKNPGDWLFENGDEISFNVISSDGDTYTLSAKKNIVKMIGDICEEMKYGQTPMDFFDKISKDFYYHTLNVCGNDDFDARSKMDYLISKKFFVFLNTFSFGSYLDFKKVINDAYLSEESVTFFNKFLIKQINMETKIPFEEIKKSVQEYAQSINKAIFIYVSQDKPKAYWETHEEERREEIQKLNKVVSRHVQKAQNLVQLLAVVTQVQLSHIWEMPQNTSFIDVVRENQDEFPFIQQMLLNFLRQKNPKKQETQPNQA